MATFDHFPHDGFMKTALLVIDVQQSFAARPSWDPVDVPEYLENQNKLIAGFVQAGLPIVRVFHEQPGDNSPFDPALGQVRPLDGLTDFNADHEIAKQRHSAFVGTDLKQWLLEDKIARLAVSGIRTEQCCETTARHGSDEGFEIDFVVDATLTFAMTHGDGSTFSVADVRQRTASVLRDRFATIVSVDDAIVRATQDQLIRH
jgi:nicotinamidase-related amidase